MARALTARSNGFVEFAFLKSDGAAWSTASASPWPTTPPSSSGWPAPAWTGASSEARSGTRSTPPARSRRCPSSTSCSAATQGPPRPGLGQLQGRAAPAGPQFFKSVAGLEGLDLTAAGTLFDGKRFWATAKIGEACPVSDRDKIGGYLLLDQRRRFDGH